MPDNIRNPRLDRRAIPDAVDLLMSGELVAFPTETVYGLGAHGMDEAAIARVFAMKQRPPDNPLIMHISDADRISQIAGRVTPHAQCLINAFWPGPLTLVLPRAKHVTLAVTAGLETVAVRVPDHPVALRLLQAFGRPIAAPSANRSGRPSPTTATHVADDFGAELRLILDGGPTTYGLESTVIDVSDDTPRLLRPGSITLEQIQALVGHVVVSTEVGAVARAPGMKHRHYAPACRVMLFADGQLPVTLADRRAKACSIGVLSRTPVPDAEGFAFVEVVPGDVRDYARALFRAFREAETRNVDLLFVEEVPSEGVGLAVMDRLRRAAQASAPEG